jgi:hypothetical protein
MSTERCNNCCLNGGRASCATCRPQIKQQDRRMTILCLIGSITGFALLSIYLLT